MESIKYKGHEIEINIDDGADSPREWDNLGNMICWHSRYNLGDKKLLEKWSEIKEVSYSKLPEYCDNFQELEEVLTKENNIVVILPLYLYDHSGISMKTFRHGQHSSWDCGIVGFIYATREQVLKEYNVKKISKQLLKKVEDVLIAEVEVYNQYISGEVYSYYIENVDSCGGYFGEENCIDSAKSAVDYYVEEKIKQHIANLKKMILTKVNILYRKPLEI